MAKQTKKAARSQQPETHNSIFDHFAAHRPEYREYGAPEPSARESATKPIDVAAELAELKRQNAELQARLSTPAIPRAATPKQEPQHVDPATLTFSTDGMPDPSLEPEKYNAELQRRVNAMIEARGYAAQQAQQAQQTEAQRAQTLWTQFATQYPDWAEHQDRVRYAAETVLAEAKAKGLDTEAYISTYADTFCADVAKKMEQVFGPLPTDDDSEDAVDEEDDSEDAGRTAGLFGGLESGGLPTKSAKGPQPGDMIKDLQDLQKRSGFFGLLIAVGGLVYGFATLPGIA